MQTKESRRHWIWLAFAVSGLPVLYMLSYGPWWFMLAHHQPPPVICKIGDASYSPIWSLYYSGMISEDLFGAFMDYNRWWVSLGGDPKGAIEPIL